MRNPTSARAQRCRVALGRESWMAWCELKKGITEAPVLTFVDPEGTIQCDESPACLGPVLTQQGKPVHYASIALTQPEKNYAQMEKELLAIVFACEHFDQYVYTVEWSPSNPITSLWNRLRRNRSMTYQRDCRVCFCNFKNMISTSPIRKDHSYL